MSYENLYQVSDVFYDLIKPISNFDSERWPDRFGWKYSSDNNYLLNNVNNFKYRLNLRIKWLDANMRDGPPLNDFTGTNWKELYSWPICGWKNGTCDIQTEYIDGPTANGVSLFEQKAHGVFKAWWPYVRADSANPLDKPVW